MKRLQILNYSFLGLFLALMASCSDEPISTESTNSSSEKGVSIKLGNKLENPYSVKNMKKALENLKKSNQSAKLAADDFEITTTHLYAKFKPKNEDELNALKADSTIVLYDHPLDYEIEVNGDYYRDPTTPTDQPTPQYCAIKIGQQLPDGVEKITLEELFIPDENKDVNSNKVGGKINGKTVSVALIDALVEESLRITNNLEGGIQSKTAKVSASKWRPSGTIKVWDDVLNTYIGVEGVQVRARRWFTTHRGFVNASGYYSCDGEFRRDANYSIDWDRHNFALQDGWLNGATYNGPKKEGNWDLNLKDDKQEYYATIFLAAHDYFYRDNYGLRKPSNTGGLGRITIKAQEANGKSSHAEARKLYGGSDISLKAWGDPSDLVYGTTIHELAHAVHKNIDRIAYADLTWKGWISPCAPSAESCDHPGPTGADARRVMETWATTVEIVLTNLRYKSYLNNSDYSYPWGPQNKRIIEQPFYTSLGYDLIDDFNQRSIYGIQRPQDRVSGYTIKQIENSLKNTNSWGEWKENVKQQNPSNPTNIYIDELFNNW